MIPTLLLLGLVFGHWWLTIPLAAAGWLAVLLLDGSITGLESALVAASFAAANTGVGVLVHRVVRWSVVGAAAGRVPATHSGR